MLLRAVVRRRGGVEEDRGRGAAAAGVPPPIGDWGWNEAAARTGRVLLERRVVRRRKVEENRMAAIAGFWISLWIWRNGMLSRGGRPKIYMCEGRCRSMLASNGLWNPAREEFGSDLEATSAPVRYRVIPTTAPLDPEDAHGGFGQKGAVGYLVGLNDY